MQIIGPRLPLTPGLSAYRPAAERESANEQAAERRSPRAQEAAGQYLDLFV